MNICSMQKSAAKVDIYIIRYIPFRYNLPKIPIFHVVPKFHTEISGLFSLFRDSSFIFLPSFFFIQSFCVPLWRINNLPISMRSFFRRAFHLYYDGFRQMTLGRTLWLIIAIKLFIIFFILKIFFFPDFIGQNAEKGKEPDFVAKELTSRKADF